MLVGRRNDKMRSERIENLCSVRKAVNEPFIENILKQCWHVRKMNENRLIKKMYEVNLVAEEGKDQE